MVVDFQTMKSEIEKTNVDLIIVDTFADFFKDDMNSATMVRDFFNTQMKPLIRKYGVTFLILHHLGKGRKSERTSKDQLVGSGSIEAAARQVLFMLKVNYDTRKIKVVKGNYLSEEDKKNEILLKMDSKKLLFQKVENSDLISKVNLPGNESQPSNNISVSTPMEKEKTGQLRNK
jgi:RecA-family ATPase